MDENPYQAPEAVNHLARPAKLPNPVQEARARRILLWLGGIAMVFLLVMSVIDIRAGRGDWSRWAIIVLAIPTWVGACFAASAWEDFSAGRSRRGRAKFIIALALAFPELAVLVAMTFNLMNS